MARQKKYGGTLYDNLSAITQERTGRKPLAPIMDPDTADVASKMLGQSAGNISAAQSDLERLSVCRSQIKVYLSPVSRLGASECLDTLGVFVKAAETEIFVSYDHSVR